MQEVAALEQVYGDVQESEGLLPMNELGIEFGLAIIRCISEKTIFMVMNRTKE